MSELYSFMVSNPIFMVIYLLIGLMVGISIAIYKTVEAYNQEKLDDIDYFLNIICLPVFFTLLYPLLFLLLLLVGVFTGIIYVIDWFDRLRR